MSDEKKMSKVDREAWLDLAGEDFLPWLQQEVGTAMARLGLRDNLQDYMARLKAVEEVGVSEEVVLSHMKGTREALRLVLDVLTQMNTGLADLKLAVIELQHPGPVSQETKPAPAAPPAKPSPLDRLNARERAIYQMIKDKPGSTHAELCYDLAMSKTTLSTTLSNIASLVTFTTVRTEHGGVARKYYVVGAEIPETAEDPTILDMVFVSLKQKPWQTANELLESTDWKGRRMGPGSLSASLSSAVRAEKIQSQRKRGDLTRYAPLGTDASLPVRAVEKKPERPAVHNVFEQLTLNACKDGVYRTVQQLVEKIKEQTGMLVLDNSVNSVCTRLHAAGKLLREPLQKGSKRFRYALKAE